MIPSSLVGSSWSLREPDKAAHPGAAVAFGQVARGDYELQTMTPRTLDPILP